MQKIIDTYINKYNELNMYKNSYECDFGSLTFIKDKSERIILYEIYIKEEYRRSGICRNLIIYCIISCKQNKKKFIIISVISKILYNFLISFKCIYGKFNLTNEGFLFKYN